VNALLVPTLGFDLGLLDRLAASIDYPIKHKVLIGNGRPESLAGWGFAHKDWTVLQQTENLGVAASWNLAPKLFPDEKCWLLCNDDCWFEPDGLRQICEYSDRHCDECDIIGNNCTWASVTWTARGLWNLGTFDENLWPAYYEDQDMTIRLKAGANKFKHPVVPGELVRHGKPKSKGRDAGGLEYASLIAGTAMFQREYIRRKWGLRNNGSPGTPHARPFNNPHNWIGHWVLEPYRRRILQGIWDTFMQQQTPSVYD